MTFSETTVAVRGTKLKLRRAGSGAPLLYLHGTQWLGWLPCLDRLASRFEVIAPDHPGFGGSDDLDCIDRPSDLANFYLDALDALSLTRVHVVGHEVGAWIGIEMAQRSAAIGSLTLIGAAGLHVEGAPKGDFFIVRPDELPAMFFADPALGARVLAGATAGLDPAVPHRNKMMAARLAWHPRLIDPAFGKWLHRVKVPTHFVWGAADRVIPSATAAGFTAHMPQARVTIIEGAGHFPHIEREEAFVAATLAHI